MSLEVKMSTKSNRRRPEYTLEFKQYAAKLVNEKGYTHQQATDSLGVSLSAMGRWVRAERGTATASTAKKAVLPLNLKKSVEFTPAKKIQHKFDKLFRLMSRV